MRPNILRQSTIAAWGITIVGTAALAGSLGHRAATADGVQGHECDCRDLDVLQKELRNALRVQANFRNKIPELRSIQAEGHSSMAELQRWEYADARVGLQPVPGGNRVVRYIPWGDSLGYQDDERVTSHFTNDKLCQRSAESADALTAAKTSSACAAIAMALQTHEDYHLDFCRSIGYRPYWLGMNGADRAQEEVEAYGVQIKLLRQAIAQVLEQSDVRVQARLYAHTEGMPNPFFFVNIQDSRTEVRMTELVVSGDTIRLEGQGQQTTNATLEGNCHYTGGVPYTLPTRAVIETDGLDAQINGTVQGAPTVSWECRVGKRTVRQSGAPPAGSMPSALTTFNVELKNGAERSIPSTALNFEILSKVHLTIDCPSRH